jgi:NAD(P)H-hydrate epimerase
MKTVSVAEMVHIDEQTIEEDCVPGAFLMDWAGEQLSIEIRKVYDYMSVKPEKIIIFAGKGNNGGDAFVAAKYLAEWGMSSEVYLTSPSSSIQGDAYFYLSEISQSDCIKISPYVKDVETFSFFRTARPNSMIVVDALLGTGVVGEPRDKVKDAIELINKLGETNYVVSVDLPSGLNGDTGESAGITVKADLTVSMAYPKKGFVEKSAIEYIGRLEVVDIGIDRKPARRKGQTTEFLSRRDVRKMFKKRTRVSHKGTYGKILIVGGARGFSGAPAMSAISALKSGVGLVSLLVPESIAPIVSSICPEAMVHWGKEENGALTKDSFENLGLDIEQFDAILIGPGMTVCEDTKELLKCILAKVSVPVVLDADALNIISTDSSILSDKGQYLLTPHVGEMARLIDKSIDDVVSSRFSSIMTAVHKYNANVILKGAGTIIALKNGKHYMNLNGNPGMATAGSGDVLAGMLAGFIPQIGPENAICASVFMHGSSGDIAALKDGQMSLSATSLINAIPIAIKDVLGR